ncbi:hypothetical protein RHSP_23272 [Rhizobium freirei PRF 81]|uniref:Uncharacterized protein n=1 Tax=Rhizobium freirei PRF 81 TaxID=363754 RepID=N6U1W9_9HYPH|nr:hypothetical protein RHSP_23272 [Rhizobium freirei PRF 81]
MALPRAAAQQRGSQFQPCLRGRALSLDHVRPDRQRGVHGADGVHQRHRASGRHGLRRLCGRAARRPLYGAHLRQGRSADVIADCRTLYRRFPQPGYAHPFWPSERHPRWPGDGCHRGESSGNRPAFGAVAYGCQFRRRYDRRFCPSYGVGGQRLHHCGHRLEGRCLVDRDLQLRRHDAFVPKPAEIPAAAGTALPGHHRCGQAVSRFGRVAAACPLRQRSTRLFHDAADFPGAGRLAAAGRIRGLARHFSRSIGDGHDHDEPVSGLAAEHAHAFLYRRRSFSRAGAGNGADVGRGLAIDHDARRSCCRVGEWLALARLRRGPSSQDVSRQPALCHGALLFRRSVVSAARIYADRCLDRPHLIPHDLHPSGVPAIAGGCGQLRMAGSHRERLARTEANTADDARDTHCAQ